MNREIKFRAWDKSFEMMYEVDAIRFFDELIEVDNEEDHQTDNINKYEVMQYTGLKDKNGTEIYEGDIVRLYDIWDELTGGREKGKQRICRVEYVGSGFLVVQGDEEGYEQDLFMAKINDDDLEVIGNVYENPELLGSDEE